MGLGCHALLSLVGPFFLSGFNLMILFRGQRINNVTVKLELYKCTSTEEQAEHLSQKRGWGGDGSKERSITNIVLEDNLSKTSTV